MSCEGGLIGQKHGGPHSVTHENRLNVNIDINGQFPLKSSNIDDTQTSESAQNIQDGVGIASKSVVEDNLHFLSGVDDLDSYDRAVVENNTEWLKSRCRNLETVDFDIASTSASEDLFGSDPLPDDAEITLPDDPALVTDFTPQFSGVRDALDELTNPTLSIDPEDKDLQGLELKSNSDKNNTLMTPQELESMPDRGLEFEESVGSKSDSLVSLVQIDHRQLNKQSVSFPQSASSQAKTQALTSLLTNKSVNVEVPTAPIQILQNTALDALQQQTSSNSVVSNVPTELPQNILKTLPLSQNVAATPDSCIPPGGNLKLATISISTDKVANSTQILVNTNQGQQLYHINTADLAQASNAMVPLSRPINEGTAAVVPNKVVKEESAAAPEQGPVQTGYLIMPTAQYESMQMNLQNGIIMQSPSDVGQQILAEFDGEEQPSHVEVTQMDESNLAAKPKRYFICGEPGCKKVFRMISKFKVHQMRHSGERPFKCSKAGCEWAFTTLYKLKRHAESHKGKKDFICDLDNCGKKFTTIYNLNSHKRLHDRPCVEQCPVQECQERFATKRQLDLHMKNHEGHEKNYKCPVDGCQKTFFSPHCMGSHPRVHTQERDLTCTYEGCGKKFDKICRLKQHMRNHTGEKPYKCRFESCGWAFTTASKLKRHQAKHTGLRKWNCQECGKAFMRAEHLKGHMMTHSGEKPYACPMEGCPIRFTAKSSLYVHIKKHENGNEKIVYHCPMDGCVKKYLSKVTLRQHMVKQHVVANNVLSQVDFMEPEIQVSEGETQSTDPATQIISVASGSNVNLSLPVASCSTDSPSTILIDPSEFITEGVSTALDDGTVHQISPDMLNQLLSEQQENGTLVQTLPGEHSTDQPTIHIAIGASDAEHASKALSETSYGSARTDFLSNHLLSDRARKRRQLLKEKISSVGADQSYNQEESVPTTSVSYLQESSTSRGITFRDPETGVLYVQTQLLQDDPPNPDLYSDEIGLSSDMSSSHDSSDSGDEGSDHFTASTINLHDLE